MSWFRTDNSFRCGENSSIQVCPGLVLFPFVCSSSIKIIFSLKMMLLVKLGFYLCNCTPLHSSHLSETYCVLDTGLSAGMLPFPTRGSSDNFFTALSHLLSPSWSRFVCTPCIIHLYTIIHSCYIIDFLGTVATKPQNHSSGFSLIPHI